MTDTKYCDETVSVNVSVKNNPHLRDVGVLRIETDSMKHLRQIVVEDSENNVIGVFELKYVAPLEI